MGIKLDALHEKFDTVPGEQLVLLRVCGYYYSYRFLAHL